MIQRSDFMGKVEYPAKVVITQGVLMTERNVTMTDIVMIVRITKRKAVTRNDGLQGTSTGDRKG